MASTDKNNKSHVLQVRVPGYNGNFLSLYCLKYKKTVSGLLGSLVESFIAEHQGELTERDWEVYRDYFGKK